MNVDLHCHSVASDGVLTPAELAARAKSNGVQLWALTDHDELSGLAEAGKAAAGLGMPFVPGVEVSVTWAGQTVHVVGLNVDPLDASLHAGLADLRKGRERRAQRMGERLAELGIEGAYEGALPYAGNPDLISRTHFARFLVASGRAASMQEVFERYLGDGKPGHVPMTWARLADALSWIHGAGGRAVLAHPGRYLYSPMQFDALFQEFKDLGGEGIEVVTGSHTPDQYDTYARVARRYGFMASSGSDFHSPGEGRMDLGGAPPLPSGLVPVWREWT